MFIGQGLMISNSRKRTKPSPVITKSCLAEYVCAANKRTAKNTSASPASSSATTSGGSILPVAAITAGEKITQVIEPANTKAAITTIVRFIGAANRHNRKKIITGGNDPNVPGQRGSQPRPKHDVSNLFIVT